MALRFNAVRRRPGSGPGFPFPGSGLHPKGKFLQMNRLIERGARPDWALLDGAAKLAGSPGRLPMMILAAIPEDYRFSRASDPNVSVRSGSYPTVV